MKLMSFYSQGVRIGVIDDAGIWDLRAVYALYLAETERDAYAMDHATALVPADMADFARINHGRMTAFENAMAHAVGRPERQEWLRGERTLIDPVAVSPLPPVLRPSKILCVGNSFMEHIDNVAKVVGMDSPISRPTEDVKISFLKAPSAIVANGSALYYSQGSGSWDYEAELAVVIGQTCAKADPDTAGSCIFGYTVMNDGSDRDVPASMGGLTSPLGKSRDTMAALGPVIVTSASGYCPDQVGIRSYVNGEICQDGNSADLLWPVNEIVSAASHIMTLHAGDVISTGSPAGVGLETGRYLKSGDVVRVEVDGIGFLENRAFAITASN